MRRGLKIAHLVFALWMAAFAVLPAAASDETVSFGVIGGSGGACDAMKACEGTLNIRVEHLTSVRFTEDPPPDLSRFDVIFTTFPDEERKEDCRKAIREGLRRNPSLRLFHVGPPQMAQIWNDWLGPETVTTDPKLAAYWGLSKKDIENMLRYALVTYLGRSGEVPPPGVEEAVKVFHPKYGNLQTVEEFLDLARRDGWDLEKAPRVALGTFRHHCIFHQPKVVEALIDAFEKEGILTACLIAMDSGFQKRLLAFEPDLVVMTSHTREPAAFWEKLNVPRIHAVWFLDESIEEWRESVVTGMRKGAIQHLYNSAEIRGATECLTSGGTRSGNRSGEEILPIPDRIRRIVGRSKGWIRLRHLENREKKIAIIGYDHSADKANLLCGAQLGLNAPKSLVVFLRALEEAGYGVEDIPADERDLLDRVMDHGRQMGSWDEKALDRLARSGKAVLVPEERYRGWYERKVPPRERRAMIEAWGEPPGAQMVWESGGERFLVLPKIDFGRVVLLTQPPKGEALTASMEATPDESLLPPTHHFMATYFWLQEEYRADALVHFGAHGNEWLFPGKQAALSASDWSDMLLGNMPNVNPWMSNNTTELVPCRRRAFSVIVDHLPPLLMDAGLGDDLLNLESTIDKTITIEEGALKAKYAASVTEQVFACGLDRELDLQRGEDGLLSDGEIETVSLYLHDLQSEQVPANTHVLGEKPSEELLIPYFVRCMGERYLRAAGPLFGLEGDGLRTRSEAVVRRMLNENLAPMDAVKAEGGKIRGGTLPEAVREGLEMVAEMDAGMDRCPLEITNVLCALNGEFVPPGPSGCPERNPGVVPTGRNMYVLNPEELPTRASWELGSKLISEYLEAQRLEKGHYPRKIAFGLVPFATYSDFGIIESQILCLLGVRPVWDAKNRVRDLEVIPRRELGRPRIDVFLSAKSVYRDELPDMMRLLDKAVRMAAALEEPDNYVFEHSVRMRGRLMGSGVSASRAAVLSSARMYGTKLEDTVDGHDWFFYLTERSGDWENRGDLLEVYLSRCKNVYTEGLWGVAAPAAFDAAIEDTELIVRSWYDLRDTVLANKFTWWSDGTLSLAIKHLTGKEPEYIFADVRNADRASMVSADRVLQRDLRTRLFNPNWIRAMMKEGYSGASHIQKNVSNLMGWEITREQSVSEENWNDLADLYVRDAAGIGLKEWFDRENPHAFQNVAATMLETARKRFWDADAETLREITVAYAESVARHGAAGGLRGGGNAGLRSFVEETLASAGTAEAADLLNRYRAVMEGGLPETGLSSESDAVRLTGNRMVPVGEHADPAAPLPPGIPAAMACLLLLALGFFFGRNTFV